MNLITAEEIIALAFTEKNFLPAKITTSHIQIAQEGFLRPAIGSEFFDYLTATTPAGVDATLVNNYIKPALAWYVRYIILPELMVRATNTGVQLVGAQGTTDASDKQAGILREQAKANADILIGVTVRYLNTNSDQFPYYSSGETKRNYSRVIGGIVFSKRRDKGGSKQSGVTPILMTGVLRTIVDVRKILTYTQGDIVICAENNYMYEFSETADETDNGTTVLAPINISGAGRWLMIKELQIVNL